MPRFTVLTHDHPTLHWDLLLEEGPILRTWRLAQPPDSRGPIDADPLPDHRLLYLDYEGPIRGNRGQVARWDRGDYEMLEATSNRLAFRLQGARLRGIATLEAKSNDLGWTFHFVAAANHDLDRPIDASLSSDDDRPIQP